jgi:mannose-6-phosphate isomerase-like protein (cupin superfamily)
VKTQESIEKFSIAEQSARLSQPFTMVDLAEVDDLALSIFLCRGTLPFHRHLDQDELFLVHSGTISLESEWGNVILRPGELATAPKGLGHRSSSLVRSIVLLFQPRLLANRRNGNRHLFAPKEGGRLDKVSVPAMGRQIVVPFEPVHLADVDTFSLDLSVCQGTGSWQVLEHQSSLVLCHDGQISLESELGRLSLYSGELAVLPPGLPHCLSSSERALILGLRRHPQPAA